MTTIPSRGQIVKEFTAWVRARQVKPHRTRRARVPTILQMEAVECGAAALAMILGHYGRRVPLEELRAACGVSRDGSKASNIVKAARTLGLKATGYKKEPADLREMPVPQIIHWNFNHFVVVEGFSKDRVYLNDPAMGPRVVSADEFDESFTGVVLSFEVTAAFARGGTERGLARSLAPRLEGAWTAVAYTVLVGLALVVPGLLAPNFLRVFVDEILVGGALQWLQPLLALMCAAAVITGVLIYLQRATLLRLETRLAIAGSAQFVWHVLRLPMGFFAQRYAGDVASRVGLNDRLAQVLSGDLATGALNLLVLGFYAALLFVYDGRLALICLGTALINLIAIKYFERRRIELGQRLHVDQGKALGAAMGGLQTIETLKASGTEGDLFARWAGYHAKVINTQQRLGIISQALAVVPPTLLAGCMALMLGLGGAQVMEGRLSIGALIAIQALAVAFLVPVNEMVALAGQAQDSRVDLTRIDDVLAAATDLPTEPGPNPEGDGRSRLKGHLELKDLTFGYSPLDPPLIRAFDLVLRPGQRVALVGGSGSGKSTVAKLVGGLYQPWSGDIAFDGRPRAAWAHEVMTGSVGVVDQEVFLFDGTVRDNIAMWDTTITDAALVEAARDACIHDDITARPGGYGFSVEEGGRNLSGGQRQRLEIARALAREPAILILDEATSALDPTTEKLIDDSIRRRGCTCLIVAHRLSTIRDCDEIIVLERGLIAERGTHTELLTAGGLYARLMHAE